ncbi:uncharacterized protein LOC141904626 [Tubulanus polymorphus]|uniref:uncharacterized protein LOC141904626 n=1 Tax=Tubulanus polymorphus TaxID=672921 RepID=UPI003DA34D70
MTHVTLPERSEKPKDPRPRVELHASWLEHQNKRKWSAIWVKVNSRGEFNIFKNSTSDEKIGQLELNVNSQVKSSTKKGWFEFKLTTEHTDDKGGEYWRKNKFRTKDEKDRNMWVACIGVVCTGKFDSNLSLTPMQKTHLYNYQAERNRDGDSSSMSAGDLKVFPPRRQTLSNVNEPTAHSNAVVRRRSSDPPAPPLPRNRPPVMTRIGSMENILDAQSASSKSSSETSGSASACASTAYSCGSDSAFGSDSGVFMNHTFFMNRAENVQIPPWFFMSCSREMAETILMKSHEMGDGGNVLIRESIKNRQHGSYSASILKNIKGTLKVQHFEIQRVVRGYRLGTMKNQPEMLCLHDVVLFLIQRLGTNYFPMSTNSLSHYGIEPPSYETQLPDDRYNKIEVQDDTDQIYDVPAQDGGSSEARYRHPSCNDDLPVPLSPRELIQCVIKEQDIYVNDEFIAQNTLLTTDCQEIQQQQTAVTSECELQAPPIPAMPHRSRPRQSQPPQRTLATDLESALRQRRIDMGCDD